MQIIICLDYSSFTDKFLSTIQSILKSFKDYEVSIIHIIDEMFFSYGNGNGVEQQEEVMTDGKYLKQLSLKYLGNKINYIEEYGLPRQKIDEILEQSQYDLLIIGSHSTSIYNSTLLGSVAKHLLRTSTKPVLVIPKEAIK